MSRYRERTERDLRPDNGSRMISTVPQRNAALTIANFINGLGLTNAGYLAGDVALFKFGLLTKRQVRKGTLTQDQIDARRYRCLRAAGVWVSAGEETLFHHRERDLDRDVDDRLRSERTK